MSSNEKFERDFEAFLNGDDAELSALYRKLPLAEPDAKLDAAVLAMAHRALNPQLVATPLATRGSAARRRARWLPALGAAATAVFAIGVAVRMAPRMWVEQQTAAPTAARDEGVVHVRALDAPAAAPEPPVSPPPPESTAVGTLAGPREAARAVAPKPATVAPPPPPALQKSAPAAPPIVAETATMEREDAKKVENVATPSAAPQAFPRQPARTSEMDAVERKEAIAEGAWQRLHDADSAAAPAGSAGVAPQAASAPAAPATRAKATAPPAAAELSAKSASGAEAREKSQALDTITVTGSNVRRVDIETANPAVTIDRAAEQAQTDKTARQEKPTGYSAQVLRNAKLYPESWMSVIQRLIRAGKRAEARQNLELFEQKYPHYHLPADVERFARDEQ